MFDGVEQLSRQFIDEFDDFLSGLEESTSRVQVIVTSQVDLARTHFDEVLVLTSLDAEASQALLRAFVRPGVQVDPASEAFLLGFAEGHPLTLRLLGALINHFTSAKIAASQLGERGTAAVALHGRTSHDRTTSLDCCLSLAFDALSADEARLLFLLANAPGGLQGKAIGRNLYKLADGEQALAGVMRWSLAEATDPGSRAERIFVLSPIAAYTDRRWRAEHAAEVKPLLTELMTNFMVMAAVIDERSEDAADIPYMLERYGTELPNLLRIIEAAELDDHREIREYVAGLCTALMRFFFVARIPKLGTHVMLRGARISLEERRFRHASSLLVMAVALAGRTGERDIAAAVEPLLRDVASRTDFETRGNVEAIRASLARIGHRHTDTAEHARRAISSFQSNADSLQDPDDLVRANNDLSAAHFLLGDALLGLHSPEQALASYRRALELLSGANVAVNDGQLHHQIGNCHSEMQRHADAVRAYLLAIARFRQIQMREYLANSLGELGFVLAAAQDDALVSRVPSTEVLGDGLDDIADELLRCYETQPLDWMPCRSATRKLLGIAFVVGLSPDAGLLLSALSNALHRHVFPPLRVRLAGGTDRPADTALQGPRKPLDAESAALFRLSLIGVFIDAILAVEEEDSEPGTNAPRKMLEKACDELDVWPDFGDHGRQWLTLYLRRKVTHTGPI